MSTKPIQNPPCKNPTKKILRTLKRAPRREVPIEEVLVLQGRLLGHEKHVVGFRVSGSRLVGVKV